MYSGRFVFEPVLFILSEKNCIPLPHFNFHNIIPDLLAYIKDSKLCDNSYLLDFVYFENMKE